MIIVQHTIHAFKVYPTKRTEGNMPMNTWPNALRGTTPIRTNKRKVQQKVAVLRQSILSCFFPAPDAPAPWHAPRVAMPLDQFLEVESEQLASDRHLQLVERILRVLGFPHHEHVRTAQRGSGQAEQQKERKVQVARLRTGSHRRADEICPQLYTNNTPIRNDPNEPYIWHSPVGTSTHATFKRRQRSQRHRQPTTLQASVYL